jgi:hypothetical protein
MITRYRGFTFGISSSQRFMELEIRRQGFLQAVIVHPICYGEKYCRDEAEFLVDDMLANPAKPAPPSPKDGDIRFPAGGWRNSRAA